MSLELTDTKADQIKAAKTELWFVQTYILLCSLPCKPVGPHAKALKYITPEDPRVISSPSGVLQCIRRAKQEIRASYSYPKLEEDSRMTHENLTEFIEEAVQHLKDLLLVRLGELLVRGYVGVARLKNKMEEVEKELRALKNFVCFVGNRCVSEKKKWRAFLRHIDYVATDAVIVSFLYLPDPKFEKSMVRNIFNLLSELLQEKIKPIDAGVRNIYTTVLRDLKLSSTLSMSLIERTTGFILTLQHILAESIGLFPLTKDQTEVLPEHLNLLRIILEELPSIKYIQDDVRIQCFRQLEEIVIDAGLVVYYMYDIKKAKKDGNPKVAHLAVRIHRVKTEILLSIRNTVQSHLPKNDALGFFDFLLDSLKELLCSHSDSLACVKNQLEELHEDLEFFQPFLNGVADQCNEKHDKLQDLAARVIHKAYEVEYIVDSFAIRDIPLTYLTLWLSKIIEEIKKIKTELTRSRKKKAIVSPTNEEMVGFEDVRKAIRSQLVGGSRALDVVSIVGMAGLGKTTLARSFLNDEAIVSRFNFRAECRVSQVYTCRDLLLSILSDAIGEHSDYRKQNESDLAARLRKILFTKRYLLIVDDVWEKDAWDGLRLCFPDTANGSRIILTTRVQDVAVHAKRVTSHHNLRLFSSEESWSLLQRKVFGKEICPQELQQVGKEIAKKCKGLPLSVVLVAGLLSRTDEEEQSWKQMEVSLGEQIQGDSKVLVQMSYNDLPNRLKPCFLYFGAFLEDREITVSKLANLWIAEGFVENDKENCLEDIAEDYLNDLIGRNLVSVAKKTSLGKIKSCRVHDLMLEFCKKKAEEENFLLWLKRDHDANPPHLYSENPMHRRLSFCCNQDNLSDWRPSCSHTRSVLFREVGDNTVSSMGNASIIFGSFKFLRVLDLEFIVVESFPTELNHLRYFSVQTAVDSIPSSIENLCNLETFLVKGVRGQVLLPDTFWKLVKLRHVRISNNAFLQGSPSKLDNLATLSSPCFSSAEDMERIVNKTPNLQKLRCTFAKSWGCEEKGNQFPALDSLARLETLKVLFSRIPKVGPSGLNFPMSLKKLTLFKFPLPLAEIQTIANLQALKVLKLQQVAFEMYEWEVRHNEFSQLKFLKIENLKLSKWDVSDEAFGSLEKLVLHRCSHLEAIPSSFEEVGELQYIEVKSCSKEVAASARNIKEARVENGHKCEIKVFS